MARNNNSGALGKGLRALIRDKDDSTVRSRSNLDIERHARNMEFYGSLMKKYVSARMEDELLEEMMEDVRVHMGITREEHQNLVQTLRRRENQKHPKGQDQERARTEIKEELSKIYQQIHSGGDISSSESRFLKMEKELEDKEKKDTIQLSNGSVKERPKVARVIKRRLVARNLDDRAGILNNGSSMRGGRIEWLEDQDEKPMMMTPPKEGLEDSDVPIKIGAPKPGLEDDDSTLITIPPRTGLEDTKEIMKMKAPQDELRDTTDVIRVKSRPREQNHSMALEMPPSTVPAGPGLGFEMIDEMKKSETTQRSKAGIQTIGEEETLADIEEESGPSEMQSERDVVKIEERKKIGTEPVEKVYDDSLLSLKMLMEDGEIQEASEMADRLLKDKPDDLAILNEKGVILYDQGDVEGSIELYKHILEMDPDSVETLINYATLLSIKGDLDDSLECLDRAVKKDPYSEDGWNNKAVVFTRAGRLREALECLDEALRINEKTPSTWMNAGIILEKMGEIEPAMECYKNLLDLEPNNEVGLQGLDYCRSILEQ